MSVDALQKVEERPVLVLEVVVDLWTWNVLELQERLLVVAMAIVPEAASKCQTAQDSVCRRKTLTLKDPATVEPPLSQKVHHLAELEIQDVPVDQEAQVDQEAERAREGHAKRPSS